MTDLDGRLNRLYAAVGETTAREPDKLRPTAVQIQDGFRLQFDGGLSKAQLENTAMQAVFHVAHLKDYLKKWGKTHGHDPAQVDQAVRTSLALKVLVDLADSDKHGDVRRDPGWSGLQPRITDIIRCLRATGGSEPPSVEFSFSSGGPVATAVRGDMAAVVTGDVVGRDGSKIGDLQALLLDGVTVFETLLKDWQSGNDSPA